MSISQIASSNFKTNSNVQHYMTTEGSGNNNDNVNGSNNHGVPNTTGGGAGGIGGGQGKYLMSNEVPRNFDSRGPSLDSGSTERSQPGGNYQLWVPGGGKNVLPIVGQRRSSLDSLMKAAETIENREIRQFDQASDKELNEIYINKMVSLLENNDSIEREINSWPLVSLIKTCATPSSGSVNTKFFNDSEKELFIDSIDYEQIKNLYNSVNETRRIVEDIIQLKKIKSKANELYRLPGVEHVLQGANATKTVLPSIGSLTQIHEYSPRTAAVAPGSSILGVNAGAVGESPPPPPPVPPPFIRSSITGGGTGSGTGSGSGNNIYKLNSVKRVEKPLLRSPSSSSRSRSSTGGAAAETVDNRVSQELLLAESIRKTESYQMSCVHCKEQDTPEWRRGPYGNRTLCNACGLFYRKLIKKFGNKQANLLMRYRREICPQDRRVPSNVSDIPNEVIDKFDQDEQLDADYNTIV
ncbi:hypothetical protein Kpol_1041p26 [Vanderwaltozyma polyspora DSM 70294]|uniref:GATA-type domain-containing protein n=1 Tax=Vanderwaltozyma polyspora (strain ATCC 22028 / DSM 70294 / BCRC 21397 / CBS 2163 / NBRC 10782 / NRRL Y-8283 / UCD 57-17) TaxID=436907 RepID=A7TL93_VANPO|nr:uncharacterized protein Kpol_1041p26 [Vanderwaltozyma polyspora DSM 70294]EDO16968.1 hypothetical protein Kpol_1041p26 [Vanderwaltozyma polyspora DSM 70294]